MSGGSFNYEQRRITDIVSNIKNIIEKNGKEKNIHEIKDEDWRGADWYIRYPEDRFHYKYPDDIIEEFKKGIEYLEKAQIYAERIDYLISGDDGEETFHERLKEDLLKL
jgi:hypothetical protein